MCVNIGGPDSIRFDRVIDTVWRNADRDLSGGLSDAAGTEILELPIDSRVVPMRATYPGGRTLAPPSG